MFLFLPVLAHGQQLKGCIKDAITNEKIPNVAVYFAGTSIGVASDMQGCFTITQRAQLQTPLVFSVLGYEKLTIENAQLADLSVVKLKPAIDTLEAVYLNPDPWTREEKERWFKKLFLGDIPEAALCTIQNLPDVRLQFNPVTNMLTAVADVPIVVENKHMGYLIRYDLTAFEALFKKVISKEEFAEREIRINNEKIELHFYRNMSSYVAGTIFFSELSAKNPNKNQRAKRRKAMFAQSVLRCFRAIVEKKFDSQGYTLFYKMFKVKTSEHIRVKNIHGAIILEFRHDKYSITDKMGKQSTLILKQQTIEMDRFGNILSPRSVEFIGHFAKLQLAGMLPLDYGLEKL